MKSKHFLQLIIFSLFIFCSNLVFAAAVPADKAKIWSEKKGRELIDALAEEDIAKKYETLDNLFVNYVDMDHIAKFVMGKYWKDMTKEQREAYIPLFKRYSLALYKSYPLSFNKEDIEFVVSKVLVERDYTLVMVNVTLKSAKEPQPAEDVNAMVEFRLHEKNGKILLTDLKIAETSFLLTYRGRFAEMVVSNDGDINWFLEDLEDSTISTEKSIEIAR